VLIVSNISQVYSLGFLIIAVGTERHLHGALQEAEDSKLARPELTRFRGRETASKQGGTSCLREHSELELMGNQSSEHTVFAHLTSSHIMTGRHSSLSPNNEHTFNTAIITILISRSFQKEMKLNNIQLKTHIPIPILFLPSISNNHSDGTRSSPRVNLCFILSTYFFNLFLLETTKLCISEEMKSLLTAPAMNQCHYYLNIYAFKKRES
jgi:hypothetical protein